MQLKEDHMKVVNSTISMLSTRAYVEHTEINEQLKAWVGNNRPDFENMEEQNSMNTGKNSRNNRRRDAVELSGLKPENRPAGSRKNIKTSEHTKGIGDTFKIEGKEKLKAQILERLIEALTGKKISIEIIDDDFKCDKANCDDNNTNSSEVAAGNNTQNQPDKQGWGVEYDYHEKHYESEKTDFSASGTVKTADGKEIDFSVDISMSREFMEEHNISIRAGDAKQIDPLVIDFSGASTELTQTKFSFDLNADGVDEDISFVNPGSGFLALDKNNDGVINDGSELFGPTTGQGFEELASYDEDGNMWIDEGDSVFKKLLVWNKNAQGDDDVSSIIDKGIGAIYLGNIATQFAIKDQANQLQGQIAQTGVYLKENGEVGTIRQIDLAA
jgi:hypothetical protein